MQTFKNSDPLPLYPHQFTWNVLRSLAVMATVFVMWGLFVDIRFAILNGVSMRDIFWIVLMPLIVLVLYLAPMLWRNVCPLSSVNLWFFVLFGRRSIGQGKKIAHQNTETTKKLHEFLRKKGLLVSALLFWLFVPARLFMFNTSSLATFYLLLFVFVSAFIMGFWFPVKSGWCASICPMAAVEKTYGMNPALAFDNTRCHFYSVPAKRVMNCSGCSFNCGDVVNPEHAYWQANSNKVFHDTVNSSIRKVFLATLPGLLLSFYAMQYGFIKLPSGSIWNRAVFAYVICASVMACFYFLYMNIKKSLRLRAERIDGALHIEMPSTAYALYKRRLDLVFMTFIMNLIWLASSRALLYTFIAHVYPMLQEPLLSALWIGICSLFFVITMFSLYNGWKETPQPDHYKPSWW